MLVAKGEISTGRFFDNRNGIFHMVNNASYFKDESKLFSHLESGLFNPVTSVLIDSDSDEVNMKGSAVDYEWNIDVKRYHPNDVTVEVSSNDVSFLVFSDTNYDGWKVFVDGKEEPLLSANYNFKAVKVPKGSHVITFLFKPSDFYRGLVLSLLGLFIVFSLLFYDLRRRHV